LFYHKYIKARVSGFATIELMLPFEKKWFPCPKNLKKERQGHKSLRKINCRESKNAGGNT
jgi:hypothetical protein